MRQQLTTLSGRYNACLENGPETSDQLFVNRGIHKQILENVYIQCHYQLISLIRTLFEVHIVTMCIYVLTSQPKGGGGGTVYFSRRDWIDLERGAVSPDIPSLLLFSIREQKNRIKVFVQRKIIMPLIDSKVLTRDRNLE